MNQVSGLHNLNLPPASRPLSKNSGHDIKITTPKNVSFQYSDSENFSFYENCNHSARAVGVRHQLDLSDKVQQKPRRQSFHNKSEASKIKNITHGSFTQNLDAASPLGASLVTWMPDPFVWSGLLDCGNDEFNQCHSDLMNAVRAVDDNRSSEFAIDAMVEHIKLKFKKDRELVRRASNFAKAEQRIKRQQALLQDVRSMVARAKGLSTINNPGLPSKGSKLGHSKNSSNGITPLSSSQMFSIKNFVMQEIQFEDAEVLELLHQSKSSILSIPTSSGTVLENQLSLTSSNSKILRPSPSASSEASLYSGRLLMRREDGLSSDSLVCPELHMRQKREGQSRTIKQTSEDTPIASIVVDCSDTLSNECKMLCGNAQLTDFISLDPWELAGQPLHRLCGKYRHYEKDILNSLEQMIKKQKLGNSGNRNDNQKKTDLNCCENDDREWIRLHVYNRQTKILMCTFAFVFKIPEILKRNPSFTNAVLLLLVHSPGACVLTGADLKKKAQSLLEVAKKFSQQDALL